MKTQTTLSYGKERLRFSLPAKARVLEPSEPLSRIDADLFRQRLEAYLPGAGLDLSRTVVVVGDKTRLCGYPDYLPVLLDCLQDAGAPKDRIDLMIAYGTHVPQGDAESLQAYGPAFRQYRWGPSRLQPTTPFLSIWAKQPGERPWLCVVILWMQAASSPSAPFPTTISPATAAAAN